MDEIAVGFVLLGFLIRRSRNAAFWQPQKTSLAARYTVWRWLGMVALIWLVISVLQNRILFSLLPPTQE